MHAACAYGPWRVGLELDPNTDRTVPAITTPGDVKHVGVASWSRLDFDEPRTFDIEDAVVSVDGERELEVSNEDVSIRPVASGPRLVDFEAVFEQAPTH